MSIKIRRTVDGYQAEVTPSPRLSESWITDTPMTRDALIDRLVRTGYHLQDIVDALTFADSDWDQRS